MGVDDVTNSQEFMLVTGAILAAILVVGEIWQARWLADRDAEAAHTAQEPLAVPARTVRVYRPSAYDWEAEEYWAQYVRLIPPPTDTHLDRN